MRNDLLVKTLGLAPFSFQSETLSNKISRQKATTDILMAHGFSAVCAHDVFEQFFRWKRRSLSQNSTRCTLDNKMANEDVYSISSDACADKMPMCWRNVDRTRKSGGNRAYQGTRFLYSAGQTKIPVDMTCCNCHKNLLCRVEHSTRLSIVWVHVQKVKLKKKNRRQKCTFIQTRLLQTHMIQIIL